MATPTKARTMEAVTVEEKAGPKLAVMGTEDAQIDRRRLGRTGFSDDKGRVHDYDNRGSPNVEKKVVVVQRKKSISNDSKSKRSGDSSDKSKKQSRNKTEKGYSKGSQWMMMCLTDATATDATSLPLPPPLASMSFRELERVSRSSRDTVLTVHDRRPGDRWAGAGASAFHCRGWPPATAWTA